ncbi:class I SAM-dependent methyltransferase [Paraburkholderia sp. RL17-337-BIB-A]|uniref:class I SAM-dependent methyltransferase n=1 Tax=Paraburkholderia sp. RL17-337-BIB-A TaxID=3031636 RepID=UPI0038BE18C4
MTYTKWRLKNIPHMVRLRAILKQTTFFLAFRGRPGNLYADFGCSNGFITSKIVNILKPNRATGFDHAEENLSIARQRYSNITFSHIDLNRPRSFATKFDVVTCFETLEHVGDVHNAVNTVIGAIEHGGVALIVVPIEHGLIGLVKLVVKLLYGYNLDELANNEQRVSLKAYLTSLLTGRRMSAFRDRARPGWGTHFGFDYRDVSDALAGLPVTYRSFRIGFNMFYRITKR